MVAQPFGRIKDNQENSLKNSLEATFVLPYCSHPLQKNLCDFDLSKNDTYGTMLLEYIGVSD